MAGAPQAVIPQMFDQFYWAERVERLGIGCAHAAGAPTTESLTLEPAAVTYCEIKTLNLGDKFRISPHRQLACNRRTSRPA